MPGEFEPIYEELYRQMQAMLPERCTGCGHTAKGIRRLAQELLAGQVTKDEAAVEMREACNDIEKYCQLGLVASRMFPDKKECSFEIKPYLLDPERVRNEYFDVRFEN